MTGKLPILISLALLLVIFTGHTQDSYRTANKQFELRAYELAEVNYLETVKTESGHQEAKLKLAECYRMMNRPKDALEWYEQVKNSGEVFNPGTMLNYAHTLKALGLYERAKVWYWNYNAESPQIGGHFASSCDFATEWLKKNSSYQVMSLPVNSEESDFGPAFYKDQLVFASFREDIPGIDPKAYGNLTDRPGNILVKYDQHDKNILLLRSENKEQRSIGPLSYSKNGKMVAYTRNNFVNGFKQIYPDEQNLSIYYAMTNIEGDFQQDKPFPYNSNEFSNAFPNLSFNGQAIYFSSNKPGGFGGFDIYVSFFKNGKWSEPENLGNRINSSGNEITPFFDGHSLYFASDYHHGFGGFDIFESSAKDGEWIFPQNLGNGLNTSADDYFPCKGDNNGNLYFTSNRAGGAGSDDIYVAMKLESSEVAGDAYTDRTPEQGSITKVVSQSEEPLTAGNNGEDARSEESANASKAFIWDNAKLSLEGARKISLGEIIDTGHKVYFIQLAALAKSGGNVDRFRTLVNLGNLYKSSQPNIIKIKLGYFEDRRKASEILNAVHQAGFVDAFITFEQMDSGDLELLASSQEKDDYKNHSFQYTNQSPYKVRLASYSDPLWFDTERVQDLGKIEQWTKGSWTIFVLSGYPSMDDASKARLAAVQRGFLDAELVIDQGGLLQRIKK